MRRAAAIGLLFLALAVAPVLADAVAFGRFHTYLGSDSAGIVIDGVGFEIFFN